MKPIENPALSVVGKEGEAKCEVTATHAHVPIGRAEQVNPAISLAISPSTDENYKTESDGEKSSNQSGTGNKPNCYKCKHRGDVAGSAHSSCNALPQEVHGKFMALELLGARLTLDGEPIVTCDPHGKRNGWFMWPMNFDPVWLESCQLFQEQK